MGKMRSRLTPLGKIARREALEPKTQAPHGKHAKTPPITVLLSQLQAGLSPDEIARLAGCSSRAIYRAVDRNGINISAFRAWRNRKADVLSFVQSRVVESAMGKIDDTGFRDLMVGFNILNSAERLERNQATGNLNISVLMQTLADLEEQEAKLIAQLGLTDRKPEPSE